VPQENLANTETYWRIDGHGPRRAFLLHCTFAHSGAWKGLMGELGDILTMEAMDLPAHGRSGGRDFSVTWQAQSMAMALEIIEKGVVPVDLIGHSFGATVAIRIAVERPDLVKTLTLIEPVFFSAARDAGRPEYEAHMADHGGFYDLLKAGDYAGAAKGFADMWGGPVAWEFIPKAQQQYMVDRITLIEDSSDTALGIGDDYIPLSRIAEIKAPALLIEGDTSEPIIAAVQASLNGALANSTRVIVKGAGHMVPITHAKKVAAEIRNLLSLN
jgi:lipase